MQSAATHEIGKGRIRLSLSAKHRMDSAAVPARDTPKEKFAALENREVDAISRPFGAPLPPKRGRGSLPEQGNREKLSGVRIY
jgi:hypothetical protein